MIAASRRWARRNRTNFAIGAGVVGIGYLAGQYVVGKVLEARQRAAEERISKENLRRRFEQNQEDCTYTVLALLPTVRDEIIGALPVEQITDQLQQERQERLKKLGGASDAASSELPSATASVADDDGRSLSSLQSGSYVHASQMVGSIVDGSSSSPRPKKSKGQLWQDMKINSITRALTLLYTLSLLTLLTRIQLNLLGRRTYLSSVVALASPPVGAQSSRISLENKDDDNYDNIYGNDFETNRKYLTFSWWLLHRGCRDIMTMVSAAVKEVFGSVNIREDLTIERLSELILQVRKKVEGSTEEERRRMKWLPYLLPPKDQEASVMRQSGMSPTASSPELQIGDPMQQAPTLSTSSANGSNPAVTNSSLRRLLDETSDLIDSPTFTHVLTLLLDTAFSHLVDYRVATEAYKATGPPAPGMEARVEEVIDSKCKLAHILPVFCRQAHAIAAGSGELDALAGVASQTGLGNEYLAAIDQVHDLEAFAAVIYSSNFEYEAAEATTETAPASNVVTTEPTAVVEAELEATNETLQEMDPQAIVEKTMEEREVVVPSGGEPSAAEASEKPAEGSFDTAWEKAVAREDGITTDGAP